MSLVGHTVLKIGGSLSSWSCIRCFRATFPSLSAFETHYDVLDVARSANSKEIRDAYIKKCKEFHPDKNLNQGDAQFKRITEAYEVLGDTQKKQSYDDSFSTDAYSFEDAMNYNPNMRFHEMRTVRDRARAYGYPEEDTEYFRQYSPTKIAAACFAFAIGGFIIHFYIAYLGYEKHTRHMNKVKERAIQANKEPLWMGFASSSRALRDQEYTESAIEELMQRDQEQILQEEEESGRHIDPFRRYKADKKIMDP
eukprot:TRINITY_DN6259_c0_g1_i1.p1 TRINITY_DN6259_c0_g1~~TRINITY_DN6259_c0_g1_i1.p1  ORF type:complete len:253 (+),score=61.24 TRINITY_DN6259_c0_g1_i1:115-873(+)